VNTVSKIYVQVTTSFGSARDLVCIAIDKRGKLMFRSQRQIIKIADWLAKCFRKIPQKLFWHAFFF
jgi:hypothetical protein